MWINTIKMNVKAALCRVQCALIHSFSLIFFFSRRFHVFFFFFTLFPFNFPVWRVILLLRYFVAFFLLLFQPLLSLHSSIFFFIFNTLSCKHMTTNEMNKKTTFFFYIFTQGTHSVCRLRFGATSHTVFIFFFVSLKKRKKEKQIVLRFRCWKITLSGKKKKKKKKMYKQCLT